MCWQGNGRQYRPIAETSESGRACRTTRAISQKRVGLCPIKRIGQTLIEFPGDRRGLPRLFRDRTLAPAIRTTDMNSATTYSANFTTDGSLSAAVREWYCVRVLARREHIAALNLSRRTGVPVFSPRIRCRGKSRKERAAAVTEALFPGYVFARFNYPAEARFVASTPGVLGLVSFGGPPRSVSDTIIGQLGAEVDRAASLPVAPLFEEGAWVRIVAGCFQGSEGRVLHATAASTRISVLLNLLGQDVQVSMHGDQLVGADSGKATVPAGLLAGKDPVGNRS